MNPIDELYGNLFKDWLEEKYTGHVVKMGLLYLLIIISLLLSVVFVWFYSWWWKMLLCTLTALVVTRFFHKIYIQNKYEEFRSEMKK